MFSFLKNLLFPIACIACRADTGSWLCSNCLKEILYEPKKQYYQEIDFPIYTLFQSNPVIRKLIHGLKYQWYAEASKFFHPFINDFLGRIHKKAENHSVMCVPVPLHRKKLRQRGFNQSEKLIPENIPKLFIQKIYHTKSQMGLSRNDRLKNLSNTFQCTSTLPQENLYIIMDDIVTTGSTMKEITRTLKSAGAEKVIGLAISRGT